MKKIILLITTLLLTACNTVENTVDIDSKQANKKLLAKTAIKHEQPIDTTKYTKVVLPEGAYFEVLRKKEEMHWKKVKLLEYQDQYYLPHGQYRFVIYVNISTNNFSQEMEITKGQRVQYIHATAGPNNEYIYLWPSKVNKESPDYQVERQLRMCTSGSRGGYIDSEIQFTEYSIDACKKLESSNQKDALAQLGYFYQQGINVSPNAETAKKYYTKAFRQGHIEAGLRLAQMISMDGDSDIEILKRLAQGGNQYAMSGLAMAYLTGTHVSQDLQKAKHYALNSVKQGNLFALKLMADISTKETPLEPDFMTAMKWALTFQKNIIEEDYRFTRYISNLAYELSESQKRKALNNLDDVFKFIGKDKQATLYIANLEKNPAYENKPLTIKINQQSEGVELRPGEVTKVSNLISNYDDKVLEIYAGESMYTYKEINFEKEFSLNLCLFYDKASQSEKILPFEETQQCQKNSKQ